MAQECGASSIVAIDVESPVCKAANKRVTANGLSDKVSIQLVEPGPLPFADEMFDLVFSKDSIIHIPDKEALALEAYRVLKPGGCFAASDWLISHDNSPSSEMVEYLKAEGLDFAMASPARYEKAMKNNFTAESLEEIIQLAQFHTLFADVQTTITYLNSYPESLLKEDARVGAILGRACLKKELYFFRSRPVRIEISNLCEHG